MTVRMRNEDVGIVKIPSVFLSYGQVIVMSVLYQCCISVVSKLEIRRVNVGLI